MLYSFYVHKLLILGSAPLAQKKLSFCFSFNLIGDLVEMDVTENTALHRVHGYLTNDGFMVATWLPNRRGPVR